MESAVFGAKHAERALDLRTLMDDLLRDQRVSHRDHVQVLNSPRSQEDALKHPLADSDGFITGLGS